MGERLKAERARLGMPQWLLAQHGQVSKDTQTNYERDASQPTAAYLARVAAFGVDVLYVVTGEKTPVRQHVIVAVEHDDEEVSGRQVLALDERAQAMMKNYMASDDEGKRTIEGTALLGAKSATKTKPRRASGGQ